MAYRLLALDYDGTLLTDDKRILPETKAAVKKAHSMGIMLLPATGRMLQGVYHAFLPEFDCAITCNGAAVYELDNKKCIIEHPMSTEKSLSVLKKLRKYNISVDAFIDGQAFKEESEKHLIDTLPTTEEMKDFLRKSRNYVDDLYAYISENKKGVHKYTLNFTPDENGSPLYRDDVRTELLSVPDITLVSGGMNNLEVTEKGISKGSALLETAEYFGIDRSEVIAFGDSENDLEMIKAAGLGIAMENSVPDVLGAADFVTRSNNENGIAYALEKLVFNVV